MCVNYAFDPPPRMIRIRLTVRIYNFGSIQCLKSRAIEFSGSLAKTLFYRYSGAIRRYFGAITRYFFLHWFNIVDVI